MNSFNLKINRMNCCWLIILVFCLRPIVANSQEKIQVNGKVEDQSGKVLQGVSVFSKLTAKGATTGDDGQFVISSGISDTLTFTFIGYNAQRAGVVDRSSLSVVLLPNNEQLSEVVVIGYGQQRKGDLTSSEIGRAHV